MKWSDLPGRHSLFWKLACLLVAFCLLMIWLSWSWGRYMEERNQFLSDEARRTLARYAAEAEQAWQQGQSAGVDADRVYQVSGKAGSDPLYPDDPTLAGNRRIAIVLLREAPVLPTDTSL